MASDDIVLITGSSGYLGAAIVRKLADEYTLVGLDRPGGPAPPSSAHQIDLDLGSDKSVGEALGQVRAKFGGRIASVIHLAAYYDVSGEPNPLYVCADVKGAARKRSTRLHA